MYKVLDEMLESIHLNRSDVYITNVVKDRPQENRDPSIEEINLYAPFLDEQISIIQPKVIATLGRFSMSYIMSKLGLDDKLGPISKIHGNLNDFQVIFVIASVTGKFLNRDDPPIAIPGNFILLKFFLFDLIWGNYRS